MLNFAILKALTAASISGFIITAVILGIDEHAASMDRSRVPLRHTAAMEQRLCEIDMQQGLGPRIELPLTDDAASFLAFPDFSTHANASTTAHGYKLKDWNLQRTVSNEMVDFSLSRINLEAYDVNVCAAFCDDGPGCKAFNIYYQRSPTVAPSEGDESPCPNPPSMTNIFCSLYSTAIKAKDMSWPGEMRSQFQIVIAGSNVFVKDKAASPSKYGRLPQVVISPRLEEGKSPV